VPTQKSPERAHVVLINLARFIQVEKICFASCDKKRLLSSQSTSGLIRINPGDFPYNHIQGIAFVHLFLVSSQQATFCTWDNFWVKAYPTK
jgi:hypothetical protein